MTRRKFVRASLGVGAAAAGYPTLIEPSWLDLTRTKIRVKEAPKGSIRILHLTDLHASWSVPMSLIEESIRIGLAENPDLVCITGDFITHTWDFDTDRYLSALQKISVQKPTYAVVGNHDGGRWASSHGGFSTHDLVDRILANAGIQLLHNRAERVSAAGCDLTLVGLADFWSDEMDVARAFQTAGPNRNTLVLSHNPDSKEVAGAFAWDLMLCGHTHGGQVIVPFEGPRYAPVRDKRFVAGLNPWNGRQIYTSRGVGNIGSVRFRCRPEVSILDLALG